MIIIPQAPILRGTPEEKLSVIQRYLAELVEGLSVSLNRAAGTSSTIETVNARPAVSIDSSLSSTSENPVQNKAVKEALDSKFDKTGGTLTGNLTVQHLTGTWLQTTAATDLNAKPEKIAVLDSSGWIYYRTPAEMLGDLGIQTGIASVTYGTSGYPQTTVTYPKPYSSKPAVLVQQAFGNMNVTVQVDDVSTEGFTMSTSPISSSGTREVMWVAIGS